MGKRKKRMQIIQYIFYTILVAFIMVYIIKNKDDFKILFSLSPLQIILLLSLSLLSPIFGTQYRKYAAKELNITLDLVDWLGIASISNLISLFVPFRSDLLISARYYKKKCNLSYGKFLSITAGGVVIQMLMVSVELILALLFVGIIYSYWSPILLIFGFSILICCVIFIYILKKYGIKIIKKLPMQKYVLLIGEGFITLLGSPRLLRNSFFLELGNQLIHALKFYFVLQFFGLEISLVLALIYSSVNILSDVFMLTPGNLGIKEVIIGAISSLMGNRFSIGVGITIVMRILSLIVYLIYSSIFALPVYRRIKNQNDDNNGDEDEQHNGC